MQLASNLADRGESRTAAISMMELQPLTIIAKCSILDVATVLDPPLTDVSK